MFLNVNDMVLNSKKLHDVISKVINLVTRLLNSDMAGVLLYDQRTDELVLQKPAFRINEDDILNSFRFPLRGGGNAVTVFITGEPYITNQLRGDSRVLQKYVNLAGAENLITVPLEVENRRIGVLHVNNKKNGRFTDKDLEVLTFLASHLAVFIENTLLYEREKKQAEELAFLNLKLHDRQCQLEKLIGNHNLLLRQVLNEEGILAIVKNMADSLQAQVMVEDRHFNLLITSHPVQDRMGSAELLTRQGKLSYLKGGQTVKSDPYINNGKQEVRLTTPIGSTRFILGYLSIVEEANIEDDSSKVIALEQGAVALALEMMKEHIKNEVEAQYRGDFLEGLFSGREEKLEGILRRAEIFGFDLEKRSRVAVISITEKQKMKKLENRDFDLTMDLRQLISAIQKFIPGSLAVGKNNLVEVLIPVTQGMSRESLTQKINETCWWGKQFYPGTKILIGIGCECQDLKDYKKSYQQALKALEIGTALESDTEIVFYDQLGVYSLLFEINNLAMLQEYVEAQVGPLLEYDLKKNSSMIDTLDKYLKSRGSLKETAKLLYVHVATVKYRMARIQELLPMDLQKSENRFNLQLALYALRILEKVPSDGFTAKKNIFSPSSLPKTKRKIMFMLKG